MSAWVCSLCFPASARWSGHAAGAGCGSRDGTGATTLRICTVAGVVHVPVSMPVGGGSECVGGAGRPTRTIGYRHLPLAAATPAAMHAGDVVSIVAVLHAVLFAVPQGETQATPNPCGAPIVSGMRPRTPYVRHGLLLTERIRALTSPLRVRCVRAGVSSVVKKMDSRPAPSIVSFFSSVSCKQLKSRSSSSPSSLVSVSSCWPGEPSARASSSA